MSNNNSMTKSKKSSRRRNKNQSKQYDCNPRGEVSSAYIQSLYNTRTMVFRPAEVFPSHFRTTLTYRQQINYTAVVTPQNYVFRGNGAFDPNQTGTGNQPVGYDQLSEFYQTYYVIGSRIKVTLVNQSTPAVQLTLSPARNIAIVTTVDQAFLYPGTKSCTMDGITRGGISYKSLSYAMSTLAFYAEPYSDDFQADISTNPTQQWYWAINFQTADQVTTISCNLQVAIDYDIVFTSRSYVALS